MVVYLHLHGDLHGGRCIYMVVYQHLHGDLHGPQIPPQNCENLTSVPARWPSLPCQPLYLSLTLSSCNFNHPVGCFPSSTQKLKRLRSGPPGVFRGAPWAPQVSQMVLQGAKRCLKVPSRYRKSSFLAEEGNRKKASINRKKASIPSCFLNIFCEKSIGTVQNFE